MFLGNVLSAGVGQAPSRQAALLAGISAAAPATTVNKVCASGMKAVVLGSQQISLGLADVVVVGGMENMSQVPFYLGAGARSGVKMGHQVLVDGIVKDGLWDVYNDFHMGNAAEICAEEHGISRREQDEFAIMSYMRAQKATEEGIFKKEIVPVRVPGRRPRDPEVVVDQDEGVFKADFKKMTSLKPSFKKDGTVTAANASSVNDGAAVLVLISGKKSKELGIPVLAKILSYADAAREPERFTIAPALAIPKALSRAGLEISQVDLFEINEAFAVVASANMKLLNLDSSKVNVLGGSVALGHPLGCSGARIICTLLTALQNRQVNIGCAGICNGGGGASAIVIQRLN